MASETELFEMQQEYDSEGKIIKVTCDGFHADITWTNQTDINFCNFIVKIACLGRGVCAT